MFKKNTLKKIFLLIVLFFSFFNFSLAIPDSWAWNIPTNWNTPQWWSWPDAWAGLILSTKEELSSKMSNPDNNIKTKLWANSWDQIDWWNWILTKIIKFARQSIFNLLWVIVVWVLLYIWFRLIIWKWTPDIFKKAIMWLVYLVIWVVLVYSAWAMIQIILWFNI
jgi:hypothetical protein